MQDISMALLVGTKSARQSAQIAGSYCNIGIKVESGGHYQLYLHAFRKNLSVAAVSHCLKQLPEAAIPSCL